MKKISIAIIALLSAFIIVQLCSSANTTDKNVIKGKVVSITDGDTFTILVDKEQSKIRLAEIDAPERKQAFGTQSRKALADKIFDKTVSVKWQSKDRYGRIIGNVYLDERWINKEMIEEGWAWQYNAYSKSKELCEFQEYAKNNKLGLWCDKNPIPPWQYRRK